ncbi:hypothetical protein [Actinomycetospora flava]|uniref:Uncharacterized protein n=1 Tax=Actinomycetospora flava TaxID=3129232 RepID=A0ABU8M066_9PSEU
MIIAAGLVGALMMSLAMTNTFSAFVATITNTNDTAAAGSLILQESGATGAPCNSTDGGGVSTNTSTCATFNKYGGSTTLVPSNATGTTNNVVTTVSFRNTGTLPATSFTMAFGACTQPAPAAGATAGTATDF